MDYSVTFARHFSRLVWLLLNQPGSIDEQKAALRAVVTVSREGVVTLSIVDWRLVVNGAPLPEALTGVQDLTAQLIGHAVRELVVAQGAAAAELLGVARALAAEPIPGDGGSALVAQLAGLGAKTVRIEVQGPDAATPPAAPVRAPAPATPGVPRPGSPAPRKEASSASSRRRESSSAGSARSAAPGRSDLGIMSDEVSGAYLAFAAVQQPKGAPQELIGKLDATKSVAAITRILDELVVAAETAARDNKVDTVGTLFHAVVAREEQSPEGEIKRAYNMALRRLNKPTLLRPVASLLPRRRDRAEGYVAVLARAGEDGADALIEQLTQAQSLGDRRIFFDALVSLKAGVSALIHMLGDPRWYVVRNAADLLGEMEAKEAEAPLGELIRHSDERVRRAAVTALSKIATPRALQNLQEALKDGSAQVRMQAAAGLAARKQSKSAVTLAKALDDEEDLDVQLSIVGALGRIGTPDAVQKLIKAAEPEGRFFKKKPVALRVAAVQALGEARTPAAMNALQTLNKDREKDVVDAVFKVLMGGGAARTTGSQKAVE
jgi:HEAT repeat protein